MWTTVLFAALAAGPRAPADAEWAAYAPKAFALGSLSPFLTRAGERSVLLRPSSWREDFHPLLSIDLTRPDELARAGIDLNGSATVSSKDDFTFTCVQLADVEKYEQRCLTRIATLGKHFRELKDGVIRVGARDTLDRVLAGYVLRGKESCAIRGRGRSVDQKFDEAAKLLGKNAGGLPYKLADGLGGAAVLVSKQGVVTLKGGELLLASDGRSKGVPTTGLLGAGPSPFALAAPEGLGWVKLRGDRARLDGATDAVVRTLMQVCFACEKAMLDQVVKGMLPQLAGNGFAYAREVQVRGSLKSMSGRFFALRHVLLADVLDEKAAREALAPIGKVVGVKPLPSGEGYLVSMKEGELRFGVRGRFLYIANDERALDAALRGAARGEGNQAHGLELRLDPRKLARALAQIPLLDALGSQELTGLVLVAGEVGPLLLGSERIWGWLDPTGPESARGHLEWTLLPAEPKAQDGGTALDGGELAGDGGAAPAGGSEAAPAVDAGAQR